MNSSDPRARRERFKAEWAQADSAARERLEHMRKELDVLGERRRELRLAAGEAAGAVSLAYDPATNTCHRLTPEVGTRVLVLESAPAAVGLEAPPATPAPLEPRLPISLQSPTSAPEEPKEKPAKNRWLSWLGDVVLWVLLLPIGGFVGVGISTIAGIFDRRNPSSLWTAVVLGVTFIAALKLMVSHLALLAGRRWRLREINGWGLAGFISVGVVFLGLEAFLGSVALQRYTAAASFTDTPMDGWQAFLVCLGITTPLLLASALKAFRAGEESATEEERLAAKRERDTRVYEEQVAAHQKRLEERVAIEHRGLLESYEAQKRATEQEREAANRRLEEEFSARMRMERENAEDRAELERNIEYQTLRGLMNQIAVLTQEIEERRQRINNQKISDGYEKNARTMVRKRHLESDNGVSEELGEPVGEPYAS
ncbi:MAG: hypothetical protein KF733_03465 [Fimbriimonadaceae bacterium]|nr:MAG: hypothetical protein KF733_03465 [Fimbriimonadaceae bacterium]